MNGTDLSLGKKRNWFQTIGNILITPAAMLPLAGLLMMLGDVTGRLGFLGAGILAQTGAMLLAQFPLLIAVCLAYGLASGQNGAAGLTGAFSYLIFKEAGTVVFLLFSGSSDLPVFSMGLLGGIIAGLIAVFFHNRCRDLKLPEWLSFFSGVRASATLAIVVSLVAGVGFGALWSLIETALASFAVYLTTTGAGGAFAYGFLSRLLMPFGLHEVVNHEIWFNMGEYTSKAGVLVTGDLNRFIAGDATAGQYIAGFYPMMIFGVPAIAACFAITARFNNRVRLILLMAVTGLVSLISGVTEPIEYMILFLSPLLYVIYAVLFGLSQLICYQLQVLDGFVYQPGLTDYLANWNLATHPERIWQIGIIMAILSFAVSYFAVILLKLRAPGHDHPEADDLAEAAVDLEEENEILTLNGEIETVVVEAPPEPEPELEPVPEPEPEAPKKRRRKKPVEEPIVEVLPEPIVDSVPVKAKRKWWQLKAPDSVLYDIVPEQVDVVPEPVVEPEPILPEKKPRRRREKPVDAETPLDGVLAVETPAVEVPALKPIVRENKVRKVHIKPVSEQIMIDEQPVADVVTAEVVAEKKPRRSRTKPDEQA